MISFEVTTLSKSIDVNEFDLMNERLCSWSVVLNAINRTLRNNSFDEDGEINERILSRHNFPV